MSYHSEIYEQEQHDSMADYEHMMLLDTKPKGRKRLITKEAMPSAVELAKKDHPYVRRIDSLTYGVRCSGKCSHGQEHIIKFTRESSHVYVTCEGCSLDVFDTSGDKICRHVAAAYGLFQWVRKVGL